VAQSALAERFKDGESGQGLAKRVHNSRRATSHSQTAAAERSRHDLDRRSHRVGAAAYLLGPRTAAGRLELPSLSQDLMSSLSKAPAMTR
jgi:hypothetical protein